MATIEQAKWRTIFPCEIFCYKLLFKDIFISDSPEWRRPIIRAYCRWWNNNVIVARCSGNWWQWVCGDWSNRRVQQKSIFYNRSIRRAGRLICKIVNNTKHNYDDHGSKGGFFLIHSQTEPPISWLSKN